MLILEAPSKCRAAFSGCSVHIGGFSLTAGCSIGGRAGADGQALLPGDQESRLLPEVLAVDDIDGKGIHVEPIKASKIHRDFAP